LAQAASAITPRRAVKGAGLRPGVGHRAGRKTDATNAHSVALVATRIAGLCRVADDQQLAVLRILADCRRSRGEDHTRTSASGTGYSAALMVT
jgi:hypothetical protein